MRLTDCSLNLNFGAEKVSGFVNDNALRWGALLCNFC